MNRLKSMTVGLLLVTNTSVWAEPVKELPNQYFDTVVAKLMMAGFRDVHVVDLETNKLAAYDPWGSEVTIIVHPSSRKVLSMNFVHEADE